jgi:Predicted divalent heavy-metal cations transporter
MDSFVIAFSLTLFAGLATAIGGAVALLSKKFSPRFLAASLGFSAGVMIFISLAELLPTAEKYGEHHPAILGVIGGIAVMGLSLLLF